MTFRTEKHICCNRLRLALGHRRHKVSDFAMEHIRNRLSRHDRGLAPFGYRPHARAGRSGNVLHAHACELDAVKQALC